MVKITYDLNNAEQCKMVEDYFFYKYYVESIIFDWGHMFTERKYVGGILMKRKYFFGFDSEEIKKKYSIEEVKKKYSIIEEHLNKHELERALQIHKKYSLGFDFSIIEPYRLLMYQIFFWDEYPVSNFKHILINRFG